MEKITMKHITNELYWDKYSWVNNDMYNKTNKKLIGTIEVDNYEYKIIAYFRNLNYGYDVYILHEESKNNYELTKFQTLKTKKSIIRAIYNFFNDIEEKK